MRSTVNSSSSSTSDNLLDRLRKSIENSFAKPNTIIQSSSCLAFEKPDEAQNEKEFLPYILTQFEKLLSADIIDLNTLRNMSWNGIPSQHRPDVWKMLLGYLPLKKERREETLKRKRKEYLDVRPMYFT